MKAYLIAWNTGLEGGGKIARQDLLDFLDAQDRIVNWRATLGSIFVATDLTPQGIFTLLHEKFPKLTFIVATVTIDSIWGWAEEEIWQFIRDPKPPQE